MLWKTLQQTETTPYPIIPTEMQERDLEEHYHDRALAAVKEKQLDIAKQAEMKTTKNEGLNANEF